MTEETTDLPGTMIMRCSRCHSTDVRRDGIACWNPSRQQWELIDLMDDAWCEGCGFAGLHLIEEHAANGQQPPGTPPIESIVTAMERAAQLQALDAAKVTPEGIERAKQLIAQEERDKAAAPATWMPRECATEGCENLGLVRFERGGVESHYCPDCYGLLTFDGNTPPDE